ncbi:high-affinity nicotinic acid transporter [Penicillium herquei]|nr:high-affinity nicotinic acid transporter [Penicillium herquei]
MTRTSSPNRSIDLTDYIKPDPLDNPSLSELPDIDHDRLIEMERTCVRKLDLVIAPLIGAFNFLSFIDRSNIGFADTQGMSTDLNLKGTELNVAISIFYVFYVLSELPISMVAKRWKFERILPSLTIAFGAVTLGSGWITNYAGLAATRLILGLFQGCLFPCLALFVANWYKREELAVRMAFLFASSALAGAFGGLVAFGIYHMDGAANIPGWRWIYIIEGCVTIAFGFVSFWLVPSSFETAWFFNETDKVAMRRRAEVMHQYSGGRGHFGFKHIVWAAKDIKTWLHACLQFCVITPLYGFNNFLPIIIEDGLGFSSVQAQYLVIPVQMWGAIIYVAVAWLSDRLQRRYIFVMIFGSITALGYILILCPIPAGAQYFSTFLITTGMYIIAGINLSWTSLNSAPDGKRGATMGITLTLTDLAGVVVGQIYPSKDKPKYYLGNGWTLGMVLLSLILFTAVKKVYDSRNEKKGNGERETQFTEWDDHADDFVYLT